MEFLESLKSFQVLKGLENSKSIEKFSKFRKDLGKVND
jgi:hypothetical protein